MAVADAFDAIVSHRSYRAGAIPFKAVQEIRAMAGTQFDPAVVATLIELWERGELAHSPVPLDQSPGARDMLDLPARLGPAARRSNGGD